jgi:hypothetical protein
MLAERRRDGIRQGKRDTFAPAAGLSRDREGLMRVSGGWRTAVGRASAQV